MKIDSNEFRVQHDENGAKGGDPDIRQGRHRSIVGLERHLRSDGTRSIEFFSHLSKEEPRKCFIERIDDPAKNRRFSAADIQERKFRPAYMTACRPCLSATSSSDSPWCRYPKPDVPAQDALRSSSRSLAARRGVQLLGDPGMEGCMEDAAVQTLQDIRVRIDDLTEATGIHLARACRRFSVAAFGGAPDADGPLSGLLVAWQHASSSGLARGRATGGMIPASVADASV